MRFSLTCAWPAAILASLVATSTPPISGPDPDPVDALANEGLDNLVAYEKSHPSANKTCTVENAAVRREWGALSHPERRNYIDAMLCLLSSPPKLAAEDAPGIRNRFDDFVSVHIRNTKTIHGTGNFLTWHRYFVWTFEQALRNECGYNGYLPYWAWNKYAHDPLHSPVFDGSEYSLSGNGEYVPHSESRIPHGSLPIVIPPAQGGGCVKTGPFKDMTVHLGPVTPSLNIPGLEAQRGNGLDYNPRCLRRDISTYVSLTWTKTSDVLRLVQNYTEIGPFQDVMQGFSKEEHLGVHGGGHYTIGGDPGGDLYVSAADPAFYIHHGMIDRVFWAWQNLDLDSRRDVVAGTLTMKNEPPSRNTTLDDMIDLGGLAKPYRLGDLLDTTGGPFCYIYA